MPVTCILSNHFKYQTHKKQVDLSADTVKVLLMRNGFVFNKDVHATKANVKGTITRADMSFEEATKHIHTAAGDFVAAGFVALNRITVSGSGLNNGTFNIVSVDSATQMTVTEALVDEGAGPAVTIDCIDELAAGFGYLQDTKTTAGNTLTEDDTNDWAQFACNSIVWNASGGSIGPTPSALLIDETAADDTIIGCIDFGGNQTAPDGADFTISNLKLRHA